MSAADGWRLAALQLLAAADSLVGRDRHETTATGQLENMRRFRERVSILRIYVEELDARDEDAAGQAESVLRQAQRPGAITFVEPEVLERCALVHGVAEGLERSRWVIVDEVSNFVCPRAPDPELAAREDWMHAQGMT